MKKASNEVDFQLTQYLIVLNIYMNCHICLKNKNREYWKNPDCHRLQKFSLEGCDEPQEKVETQW